MGRAMAHNHQFIHVQVYSRALNGYHRKPLVWEKFIDCIFTIWTRGEELEAEFIEYLNSIHESIKFTHGYSKTSVDLLDATIKFNQDSELITTL